MADRVPIQQAIEGVNRAQGTAEFTDRQMRFAHGQECALRDVQSGEIVTVERAALEAMAEHECRVFKTIQCTHGSDIGKPAGGRDLSKWCAPCWARHTLNEIDNWNKQAMLTEIKELTGHVEWISP